MSELASERRGTARRRLVAAGALAVVLLSGGTTPASAQPAAPEASDQPPPPEPVPLVPWLAGSLAAGGVAFAVRRAAEARSTEAARRERTLLLP